MNLSNLISIKDKNNPNLIELSFSKAKHFMRCKKRYDYRYNQKLTKKTKSLPLRRGSWIHECLETYYRDGDWKIGYEDYLKETWKKMFDEEKVEYGDLPQEIERIIKGYIKKYNKQDSQYKVIAVEQEFEIQIPGTNVVLTGVIDLIIQDALGIWIIDHKSVKNIPTEEFRLTDTQLSIYYWVVQKLKPYLKIDKDTKISGVMFNYIRTKVPTKPQVLKNGGLSKRKDIDCDYDTYYNAIIENGLNPEDYLDMLALVSNKKFYIRRQLPKSSAMVKEVILDLIEIGENILDLKVKQRYPRNFTRDCSWDCEFKDLCISELHGHDIQFIIENEFEEYKKKEKEDKNDDNE